MSIRTLEAESIRVFVESCGDVFRGARVLDYGCGRQPYRALVESFGAGYCGYDRAALPGNVSDADVGELEPPYDAILCTQVIPCVDDPEGSLRELRELVVAGGHLVLTYSTVWPEIDHAIRWHFTRTGMETLLGRTDWQVVRHDRRALVQLGADSEVPLGYGVVARR